MVLDVFAAGIVPFFACRQRLHLASLFKIYLAKNSFWFHAFPYFHYNYTISSLLCTDSELYLGRRLIYPQ